MSGDKTASQLPGSAAAPAAPVVLTPAAISRVRRLLVAFSVLFAIWIAAMIAMYAKTVYPQRHPASVPSATSQR
jgi:hypothetical protein